MLLAFVRLLVVLLLLFTAILLLLVVLLLLMVLAFVFFMVLLGVRMVLAFVLFMVLLLLLALRSRNNRCNDGNKKASVLPVPVRARATTSCCPPTATGNVRACTSVSVRNRAAWTARCNEGCKSKSVKLVGDGGGGSGGEEVEENLRLRLVDVGVAGWPPLNGGGWHRADAGVHHRAESLFACPASGKYLSFG